MRVCLFSFWQDLFTTMKVVDVVELGLGANAALSDIHRLHWNTDAQGETHLT